MNILFLDTSTDYAILGICDQNGTLVTSLAEQHERQLSVKLYPMIDHVLKAAGILRDQVDGFSVGLGPGSFTGVRVAVTTLRTLAQVVNKPLVAFNTLDAFAISAICLDSKIGKSPMLVLYPSRRNEAYVGAYPPSAERAESVVMSYDNVKDLHAKLGDTCTIVGPEQLINTIFPDYPRQFVADLEHPDPIAIAKLTQNELRRKNWRDPLSLDPMYIAPPAVSQHKQIAK